MAICAIIARINVSEISNDLSENYMPVSSSVGFFTIVQNDE